MTYSEKLRDPRWQKKRLQIFDRDNWKCRFCDSKDKNLQVHHVIYGKREPWDYPDYLYQTTCEDCHKLRHDIIDRIISAIRIGIKETPTNRLELAARKICDNAMLEIGMEVDN